MRDKTDVQHAIIARGLQTAVIMATDGNELLFDVDNISDGVADVIGDDYPDDVGLYLWTGYGKFFCYQAYDGNPEPELEWVGEYTPATSDDLARMIVAQMELVKKRDEEYEEEWVRAEVESLKWQYLKKEITEKQYRAFMGALGYLVNELPTGDLKKPDEFFTDPKPSTMMEEAKPVEDDLW